MNNREILFNEFHFVFIGFSSEEEKYVLRIAMINLSATAKTFVLTRILDLNGFLT